MGLCHNSESDELRQKCKYKLFKFIFKLYSYQVYSTQNSKSLFKIFYVLISYLQILIKYRQITLTRPTLGYTMIYPHLDALPLVPTIPPVPFCLMFSKHLCKLPQHTDGMHRENREITDCHPLPPIYTLPTNTTS